MWTKSFTSLGDVARYVFNALQPMPPGTTFEMIKQRLFVMLQAGQGAFPHAATGGFFVTYA